MRWFGPTEREKWASPAALSNPAAYVGLPALDSRSRELFETVLPRGVLVPRFVADRAPVNHWMPPHELLRYAFLPGQIILGKFPRPFLALLSHPPLLTPPGA